MRLLQLSLILILTFAASGASGQYYMFDANENGVAFEFAQARQNEITARGIGLTVKTQEDAGVFLGYSWAGLSDDQRIRSYTVGFERYLISKNAKQIHPIVVPSLGLDHTTVPDDFSVTSLIPGAALGFMGPISQTGRTVTEVGVAVRVPIRSSDGVDTRVTTTVFVTSTVAFRLTPKLILGGGVTYSDSNTEGSEGLFNFKIGVMFANPIDN